MWVILRAVFCVAAGSSVSGTLISVSGHIHTMVGDVTGTHDANTVAAILGRTLATTAPTDTQVLKWNDATSEWVPSADVDTDTQLSEASVETFITNGAIDLAAG